MIRAGAIALAVLGTGGWTAPATAKPGDKAWATCVWQTTPTSAVNWLGMTPPDWQAPFESPASLVGLRLSAICGTAPAAELKPNRYYNFKTLAAVLKASRPASAGVADAVAARTELCRHRMDVEGRKMTYRYDVVRIDGAVRTVTFQQFYDEADGMPIRLPQDIRILPKADQTVTTLCNPITSSGTLADA